MSSMDWYAVRHVIENGGNYEERVTLWRADSFENAIAQAETEAADYASKYPHDGRALGLFQSFKLADSPGDDGAEVFSLIRASALSPDEYLNRFFDTGAEFQSEPLS